MPRGKTRCLFVREMSFLADAGNRSGDGGVDRDGAGQKRSG